MNNVLISNIYSCNLGVFATKSAYCVVPIDAPAGEIVNADACLAVSLKLSESLACRVLAVDANFGSATFPQGCGKIGLRQLFDGENVSRDDLYINMRNGLFILLSGQARVEDRALLATEGLNSILTGLRELFDVVVFQLPHANAAFGGLAQVARKFDGVIITLTCGRSRWEAAQNNVAMLKNGGARITGALMEKRKFAIPQWLYSRL